MGAVKVVQVEEESLEKCLLLLFETFGPHE